MTGTRTTTGGDANSRVAFKNCAPFIECTLQINDEHIEQTRFLDIIMTIYNLIEYLDNYQDASATPYQYKRDEPPNNIADDLTTNNSSSFKYKASLLGTAVVDGANAKITNAKIVVPLKYLSNFFRSLEMPLINCKVHLDLKWTKNCLLYSVDGNTEFQITDTKLLVPVVTLSKDDNKYCIEQQIKDFSDQFTGMSTKQKKKILMQLSIFTRQLVSILLFKVLIDCLSCF